MTKTARSPLTSLTERLVQKSPAARPPAAAPDAVPAAEPAATPDVETAAGEVLVSPAPAPAVTEGPRDLKTMMCRVNRAGWQEMSRLAIELDRNLEDLLIEACNDLLSKNGHPPVIEKRSPTRR